MAYCSKGHSRSGGTLRDIPKNPWGLLVWDFCSPDALPVIPLTVSNHSRMHDNHTYFFQILFNTQLIHHFLLFNFQKKNTHSFYNFLNVNNCGIYAAAHEVYKSKVKRQLLQACYSVTGQYIYLWSTSDIWPQMSLSIMVYKMINNTKSWETANITPFFTSDVCR